MADDPPERTVMRTRPTPVALVVTAALLAPSLSFAQTNCEAQWLPAGVPPPPNLLGQIYTSTVWDADGAGPTSPKLVVGGSHPTLGLGYGRIAAMDLATGQWSVLAAQTSGTVNALTALPNGDLIAGGDFSVVDGTLVMFLGRWNGSSWSPVGTGMNNGVTSLLPLPNGDLIVGGFFTSAGGTTANRIARWNGTQWSTMGSGLHGSAPYTISVYGLAMYNGDIVAAGNFTVAGSTPVNRIARWNGNTWSALGSGMDDWVWDVTSTPNGDLVAGGLFTTAGGAYVNGIARWNGSAWSSLGSGVDNQVISVVTLPNGDLVAGGYFNHAGGTPASNIARWNGTAWSPMGLGVGAQVLSMSLLPDSTLAVSGWFNAAGGAAAPCVALWGVPPVCNACDPIDFNADSLFPDTQDIADFLSVFAGGVCSGQLPTDPPCNTDIDFNSDTLFPDTDDIGAFLRVFAGGACSL